MWKQVKQANLRRQTHLRLIITLALSIFVLMMQGCFSAKDAAEVVETVQNITDTDNSDGSSTDNSDTSNGDPDADTEQLAETKNAQLILFADKLNLPSGSSGVVRVTANVKDEKNVVLDGEQVTFSATSGSLRIEQGISDDLGNAVAILTTPYNPSSRIVTVTAAIGSEKADVEVFVTGSSINIDGPVASIAAGGQVNLVLHLKAGDGSALKDELVSIQSSKGNPLSAESVTTDDQGQAVITVTDASGVDDTITVNALNGSVTADYTLKVSQLNALTFDLAGDTELPLNQNQQISVTLVQNGVPAIGQQINFYTNRGVFVGGTSSSATTEITDTNGKAVVTLNSDNAGGVTISAETATESAQRSFEFVATTPASIKLEASPSTVSFGQNSNLSVIVRDANDNLVKNADIVFHITSDITTGVLQTSGIVKTNGLGQSQAIYTAGQSASGEQGVEIEAYIADLPGLTPAEVKLTVEPINTRIVIGTGNEILEPNSTQYEYPYVVQVSDDGKPVAGAEVNILAFPVSYSKGKWVTTYTNVNGDLVSLENWISQTSIVCPAEDIDKDGELDANEDKNGDGTLTPPAIATVVNATGVSDENGFAYFSIIYPQNYAHWVTLELRAQTSQPDGEATAVSRVTLTALASDLTDIEKSPPSPDGKSPFGVNTTCNDID